MFASLVLAALISVDAEPAALAEALRSKDALTRSTAARIATVRNVKELAPAVREVLAAEGDANAAREQIRALVLLGSDEDVALAAAAAKRFPASMDAEFSDAVSRLGAPHAIDLYFAHVAPSRRMSDFFSVALWRRPDLATSTASRLLGAKDERGFVKLLDALEESTLALNSDLTAIGLTSNSETIREATVWYVVRGYAADPSLIAKQVREVIPYSDTMSVRETFGREVVKRMLGGNPVEVAGALEWVKGRSFSPSVLAWMTEAEQSAARSPLPGAPKSTTPSIVVRQPGFIIPNVLPPGLATAVMRDAGCRGSWLGVASATIDAQGRVVAHDVSKVETDDACRRALSTLMRLSLATPGTMRAAATSDEIVVVKAKDDVPCLDETPIAESSGFGDYAVGGDITAPIVVKRYQPEFAESARAAMGHGSSVSVIIEALITTSGCIRRARLLTQAPHPSLNGAALLAVSKWKFTPGKLNGIPVDVIFHLNINFKIP